MRRMRSRPSPVGASCGRARSGLAMSHWLAGEVDQADDLFADVAEEGLELGVAASATALGERALIASARGRGSRPGAHRPGAPSDPPVPSEGYPTSALTYAVAARRLHRDDSAACQELLTQAQRLRPRLTHAMAYYAVQTRLELARAFLELADAGGAATMLRESKAILRRRPDLGVLPGQVEELGDTSRPCGPGARGLDPDRGGAAPAAPPRDPPLVPRDRRAPVPVAPHGQITRHGHLPQAQRHLRNAAVEHARELGLI